MMLVRQLAGGPRPVTRVCRSASARKAIPIGAAAMRPASATIQNPSATPGPPPSATTFSILPVQAAALVVVFGLIVQGWTHPDKHRAEIAERRLSGRVSDAGPARAIGPV